MSSKLIKQITDEFWAAAGKLEPFPRNLEAPVTWVLPLAIVKLPKLGMREVVSWVSRRGCKIDLPGPNRLLRGCLVAFRGKGFVLLDGTDPVDHQRYSLAHEVGHFVLDYLYPRERAVSKFGITILEVLDGIRPATDRERFHSIISDTTIRPHIHLMDRRNDGLFGDGQIALSESTADRLALELLAPELEVKRHVESLRARSGVHTSNKQFRSALISKFGLPSSIAGAYADWLCRESDANYSIRKWLGV